MPLRIIVTPGISCTQRSAQDAAEASGRSARSFSCAAAVSYTHLILPILIIVTMFSVLVNYYNDRNLEQAMDLGMENAMQQVELRLLSVIEDSKAVSYDGIVRQSYSESRSLVYKDVTEYLTQKFTRNANYRCVFISSVGADEPVHAYAAAPGTARLNLLRDYKAVSYTHLYGHRAPAFPVASVRRDDRPAAADGHSPNGLLLSLIHILPSCTAPARRTRRV